MPRLHAAAAGLALLTVAGCSLFEDPAEVSFVVSLPPEAAALDVEAAIGGRAVELTLLPSTGGPESYTEPVETAARRTALSCSLAKGAATTRAAVTLDLEAGLRYPVRCAVQARSPAEGCFGCAGSERFALDPALGLADSLALYLVWSVVDPDVAVIY